jgi:hypothetical protein
MTARLDSIAWLPLGQVLRLSELSRSTLQSWIRAGLKPADVAAYDLAALLAIVLLAACRKHLTAKQLVGAWRSLEQRGVDKKILESALKHQEGDRFDLVIDTTFDLIEVARSDAELAKAVRRQEPRPVIVVDVAEKVMLTVRHFDAHANKTARPDERSPGRPRSTSHDNVRHAEFGSAG